MELNVIGKGLPFVNQVWLSFVFCAGFFASVYRDDIFANVRRDHMIEG